MFYIGLIIILILTIVHTIINKETIKDGILFFILSVILFLIIECVYFTISRAFMGDSVIDFFFRFS